MSCMDNIGIVTECPSLHRAQNLFGGEVQDVMYLYALGKRKGRCVGWRHGGNWGVCVRSLHYEEEVNKQTRGRSFRA